MKRAHLVFLLLGACTARPTIRHDERDSVPASPGDNKSGSRLKLRSYVGADGSEQVVGFYDSTRHENCVFKLASDGNVRCLPDIPLSWTPMTRYYSDPTCSNEVYGLPHGCQTSNIELRAKNANRCNDGVSVFPLGTRYTGQVYEDDVLSGQCLRAQLGGLLAGQDFWVMGAEIPPSSFVAAHEVVK